jgi:hypothetical protein
LTAVLQLQIAIWNAGEPKTNPTDRPHVGINNIEMMPLRAGENISVDLKIKNSGPGTAIDVRITANCSVQSSEKSASDYSNTRGTKWTASNPHFWRYCITRVL